MERVCMWTRLSGWEETNLMERWFQGLPGKQARAEGLASRMREWCWIPGRFPVKHFKGARRGMGRRAGDRTHSKVLEGHSLGMQDGLLN